MRRKSATVIFHLLHTLVPNAGTMVYNRMAFDSCFRLYSQKGVRESIRTPFFAIGGARRVQCIFLQKEKGR
jgi:hypothetical protein